MARFPRRASPPVWLLLLAAGLFPPGASHASTPGPAGAAAGQDPDTAVRTVTTELQRNWNADRFSASLAFPPIRLLPAGAATDTTCNPGAAPLRPGRTALYCAARSEVLLDRDLLGPLLHRRGLPAVAYWIAVGLAERLIAASSESQPSAAAGNLTANCLAGVLLGASRFQPAAGSGAAAAPQTDSLLNAARGAYGGSVASTMGSASQRAYALLSGLGATASSCSPPEMAALARGSVPDPALLTQLQQLPPVERGSRSLMAVINSQCRPLGYWTCPRRLQGIRQSAR